MYKKNLSFRIISWILVTVLFFSFTIPSLAEQTDSENQTVSWKKIDNKEAGVSLTHQEIEESTASDSEYDDKDIVRVSIFLNDESTLDAGFSTQEIAENDKAMKYRSKLTKTQNTMANMISEKVLNGNSLDVVWNLTLIENIISANVPYGKIEQIKALKGVSDVIIEPIYEPCVCSEEGASLQMATSSKMIGSTAARSNGYTGAGSRIAIIDTGIDTDHQSFSNSGFEYSLQSNAKSQNISYKEYVESLNLLTAEEVADKWDELNFSKSYTGTADATYFGTKIPFGANYVDTSIDITHDNDNEGSHGSHVAGIAAANSFIPDGDTYSPALDSVKMQGVAPDAQIIVMKVFGKKGGAHASDYMVAIEDAIILDADSINLSLSSINADSSTNSVYQKILNSLSESDTVVAIAAGNNSAWADNTEFGYLYSDGVNFDNVASPGSYTNSLAVASVDNDGSTNPYIILGENTFFYAPPSKGTNPLISTIAGKHDYIYIDSIGTSEEFNALSEVISGKIAICNRGTTPFIEKAAAAESAGAIACIIVNNQPGTLSMDFSNSTATIPCISVIQSVGDMFKSEAEYIEEGDYYIGSLEVNNSNSVLIENYDSDYYTMSSFSSMGVPGSLELKPEITAPGGNVYSINGAIAGGKSYKVSSGTSMAAPQIAGMNGLIAQYIRNTGLNSTTGLSTRQLSQSLLMSTATPLIEEKSGGYYSVMKQGAGLANVDNAICSESYIIMDKNATKSAADGKVKAELGDDPNRTGKYSFSFEINNLTDRTKSFELSSEFFTQDCFSDEETSNNYLNTSTIPLNSSVTWYADGKKVSSELSKELKHCDFDDDGFVTDSDGQTLLDYVVGKTDTLSAKEYADIDCDGDIDTHDVYCFISKFNTGVVELPASGSVRISVSATMTNISDYDDCGAYVEGYVFANELTSKEGKIGDSHSIPVLAYYGGWDESSMFDISSYPKYLYEKESRLPYTYKALGEDSFKNNAYFIRYAGDNSNYYFGGNPFIRDETYHPERNAINNENGDQIYKIRFSSIRNATASRFSVTDEDGKLLTSKEFGSLNCAFYYTSYSKWFSTRTTLKTNYVPKGIANGSHLNLNTTLVPEYYIKKDGSVDWDSLNEAASFSMPVVIDNTMPEIIDIRLVNNIKEKTNSIELSARDNEYIAAVALFDSKGNLLGKFGSDSDALPREELSYSFNIENPGEKYLIQVFDYASNCSSYKINLNDEEVSEDISIKLNSTKINLFTGNQYRLSAVVSPWGTPDDSVIWTSDNDAVATVNSYGLVTGIGEGTTNITATSNADPSKSASCKVTVRTTPITIHGLLNNNDGVSQPFSWNIENDDTPKIDTELDINFNTYVYDRVREYAYDESDKKTDYYHLGYILDSKGYMHAVNTDTWEIKATSENSLSEEKQPYDMDFPYKYNDTNNADYIFGIYDGNLLKSDSALENAFNNGWDLNNFLSSYTGATRFTAMAWGGFNKQGNDIFFLLDNANKMWVIQYDGSSSIKLNEYNTDLNLEWPTFNNKQNCSMILGDDDNLYLSYFTGNLSELYLIYYDAGRNMFNSKYIGNFGNDIWPCALGSGNLNPSEASLSSVLSGNKINNSKIKLPIIKENFKMKFTCDETNITMSEILQSDDEQNKIIENTSSKQLKSQQNTKKQAELSSSSTDTYVNLNISPSDCSGKGISSNNGLLKLEYNHDSLQLVNVDVAADYNSVNDTIIGYANLNEIKSDETVAKLTFKVLNFNDDIVKINTVEVNNDKIGYTNTIDLSKSYPRGNSSSGSSHSDKIQEVIPENNSFEDVHTNDYFYNAVFWALKNNITSGIDTAHFAPNDTTTRSQAVTFIWRAAGCPEPNSSTCKFTDVNSKDYYYKAVIWASENGITSGIKETKFAPDNAVTRAQAVTFLWRYENMIKLSDMTNMTTNNNVNSSFTDVTADAYYCNAVLWAKSKGITSGVTEKEFAPDNICTRAQVVTFLYRDIVK